MVEICMYLQQKNDFLPLGAALQALASNMEPKCA